MGFEIRAVGANPDAARYAGMRPRAPDRSLTMTLGGVLGGPGRDAVEILGVTHYMPGRVRHHGRLRRDRGRPARPVHPSGSLFAALLFGAMRAGRRH